MLSHDVLFFEPLVFFMAQCQSLFILFCSCFVLVAFQADGSSVHWLSANNTVLTLWNFVERRTSMPCTNLYDVTTGVSVPPSQPGGVFHLAAMHTYTCDLGPWIASVTGQHHAASLCARYSDATFIGAESTQTPELTDKLLHIELFSYQMSSQQSSTKYLSNKSEISSPTLPRQRTMWSCCL